MRTYKYEIFFIALLSLCLLVFLQGFIFGDLTVSDFSKMYNEIINLYK